MVRCGMQVYQVLRSKTQLVAKILAGRLGHFGIDPFFDMKSRGILFRPKAIFDVGANHGAVATRLAKRFPEAMIFAFEPSQWNFSELSKRVEQLPKVRCIKAALSSSNGVARFQDDERAHDMSRLTAPGDACGGYFVQTQRLTDFCCSEQINHIDYLKIDTEGHDQDVLLGAKEMLQAKSIDFVEVEAGVNPENKLHVPLEIMKTYLEGFNYRLFGIYEQIHEWPTNSPNLRRVNAVFMRRKH
jgi:FkbM family methyltransferase